MTETKLRRPTTLEEYREAGKGFATKEGWAEGLAFRPRPSDVFIATYAKAGTTWMQQIVHGLRTGGDMNFGEITEVVPWVEMAVDLGLDAKAEQKADPRAFKTHLSWDDVPKGGRYIAIIRHPYDIALSFYRFMDGWHFESGSISLDAFVREEFVTDEEGGGYWRHTLSWWQQRLREDVLFLTYEAMKADLPATVRKVAGFMGLDPASPNIAIATKQASFDFMKVHASQFDDNLVRRMRDAACGLPEGGESNKVSSGTSGGGRVALDASLRELLDAKWREVITPQTGLADYEAMQAALSSGNAA
jgi:hypothetical protein